MKHYAYFLILPLFMLSGRCADESEENQFYKNERLKEYRYDEHPVTKTVAIENWESFLQESQDLVSYSRANLETFQNGISDAEGASKLDLMQQYDRYKKAIDKLEKTSKDRNAAFNEELSRYEQTSHERNEVFAKQFKREIIRINIGLGCKPGDEP